MATVLTATHDTHTVELTIHHGDEPWIGADGRDWIPELALHLGEDGSARLKAAAYHRSDAGEMSVWNGWGHEWRRSLPEGALAVADPDRLIAIGAAVLPFLLRVHLGNLHGRPTEDAKAAHKAVAALLGDSWDGQDGMAWPSDEWLARVARERIDPVADDGATTCAS